MDVDLDLPSQGKPIHGFIDTDVRKYRFGNRDAVMIDPSPLLAIYLCGHGFSQIAYNTPHRNHHIPAFRLVPPDAPGLKLTPLAPLSIVTIPSIYDPVIDRFFHLKPKDSPLRTTIFIPFLLVLKITSGQPICPTLPLSVFPLKPGIPTSKPLIRNIRIQSLFLTLPQIRWTVIVAVCREGLTLKVAFSTSNGSHILFRTLEHRRNKMKILCLSKRLCMDNDLVLRIHESLPVISLNRPVRGDHLRRFIVRDITLNLSALSPHLWTVLLQPPLKALCFLQKPLDLSFPLCSP